MGCAFGEESPPVGSSKPIDVVSTLLMGLIQKHFPQASDAAARSFAEELRPELPQLAIRVATPIALGVMLAVGVVWLAARSPAPASRRKRRRR